MSPFTLLERALDNFTKKEAAIALYILEDTDRIIIDSPADIVKKANSSKSAFVRMCQKINFTGYVDFRYACIAHVEQYKNEEVDPEADYALTLTNTYIKKMEELALQIDRKTLEEVSQLILNSNRIRSYGYYASLLVIQQLQLKALTLGLEIIPSSSNLMLLKTLPIMNDNDLLLYFAVDANSAIHQEIMTPVNEATCKKVLITMVDLPADMQVFDYTFILPSIPISTTSFYLDNQTTFVVFSEFLMKAVENKKINN